MKLMLCSFFNASDFVCLFVCFVCFFFFCAGVDVWGHSYLIRCLLDSRLSLQFAVRHLLQFDGGKFTFSIFLIRNSSSMY